MKLGIALAASLITSLALAFTVQASPHAGKRHGNSMAGHHGKNMGHHPKARHPAKGAPHAHPRPGKRPHASGPRGRDFHPHHDYRSRHYGPPPHVHRVHPRPSGYVRSRDMAHARMSAALARQHALHYGLRGYSALPPGIRVKLARGQPLPRGIARRMVPGVMLGHLPRHPGYEWRIVGTDLILISVATAVIADVLYDVFG